MKTFKERYLNQYTMGIDSFHKLSYKKDFYCICIQHSTKNTYHDALLFNSHNAKYLRHYIECGEIKYVSMSLKPIDLLINLNIDYMFKVVLKGTKRHYYILISKKMLEKYGDFLPEEDKLLFNLSLL